MLERWLNLCGRIGTGGDPAALFIVVEALHAHPPRAYHSLAHVAAVLALLDQARHLATDPDAIEMALWLHDCVYVPGRSDNEERSADVAGLFLRELHASPEHPARVRGLIMATRHTGEPLEDDHALIADIDMAILAAPESEYDEYARAIHREYGFASDDDYRRGRASFLGRLLEHPAVFHSGWFKDRFEQAARSNISRELESLK